MVKRSNFSHLNSDILHDIMNYVDVCFSKYVDYFLEQVDNLCFSSRI